MDWNKTEAERFVIRWGGNSTPVWFQHMIGVTRIPAGKPDRRYENGKLLAEKED